MKCDNLILAWVAAEQKPGENLAETLARIVKSKRVNELVDIVLANPRDNKAAYRAFAGAFKDKVKWHQWYNLYTEAYGARMNEHLKSAERVEDILRYVPDLSPWTLEQRFGTIKIGQVPDVFGSESRFHTLVAQINKSIAVKNFKKIKKLECHLPDFQTAFPTVKKIDWFNFSERSDFLRALMQEKCGKPFAVRLGDTVFHVLFLCNPFSSKLVFQISAPDGQKFIMKSAPYSFLNTRNDRVRKEHENMAIRADSTYSDAMLEFYLKLNNCPHAPNILYYHFSHEIALYRLETGHPFHTEKNKKKYLDFYTFNTCVVPDAVRLGVYVNDVNAGNFLVSDKDKAVKIIDIGHATYANPLTPGVPGMTFTLGNLCGRDYISIHGVLDMEDV